MAGKKKVEIFVEIQNEHQFFHILDKNADELICAEIYSNIFGSCTCLDRLFTKIKLDWTDGKMLCLKVPSDNIECLSRFREHSEPVYMFIFRKKVTNVFRGVDSIKFAEVARNEWDHYSREMGGEESERIFYELDEPTPEEKEWLSILATETEREKMALQTRQSNRQAARKRHRAELMVPHLQHLNFVLYWPHCHHAHPALYERWAENNIFMVAREEIQLSKEMALDVLYAGDAPINEASMHQLLSGPALAICFRLLDADVHFVSIVRKCLYEERLSFGDEYMETAFNHFKSYSKLKEEILQERREEKKRKKEEEIEKRTRRLSEMQRLAREARQEAIEAKRAEKERLKIELLKRGRLDELNKLKEKEDNDEDIELRIPIPQELPEEFEEENSEEDADEYFPLPGLIIPGFYAPPNDIAKVNGLAILFPSLVLECVTPHPEHIPPHMLVMLDIKKRHEAIQALRNGRLRKYIIHMGIFRAKTPYKAVHVAYSVKQFDAMASFADSHKLKIAFMISLEKDLAVLELMDLNPTYVSRDHVIGEEECAAMFPVDYGDNYDEFEDFETVIVPKSSNSS